jgi:hypothetical protein
VEKINILKRGKKTNLKQVLQENKKFYFAKQGVVYIHDSTSSALL